MIRNLILAAAAGLLVSVVAFAVAALLGGGPFAAHPPAQPLSYADFQRKVEADDVAAVAIEGRSYHVTDRERRAFIVDAPSVNADLYVLARRQSIRVRFVVPGPPLPLDLAMRLLPLTLVLGVVVSALVLVAAAVLARLRSSPAQ